MLVPVTCTAGAAAGAGAGAAGSLESSLPAGSLVSTP